MPENQKMDEILTILKALQADQGKQLKALQATVEEQGKQLKALQATVEDHGEKLKVLHAIEGTSPAKFPSDCPRSHESEQMEKFDTERAAFAAVQTLAADENAADEDIKMATQNSKSITGDYLRCEFEYWTREHRAITRDLN
jgi:hypothetical protein